MLKEQFTEHAEKLKAICGIEDEIYSLLAIFILMAYFKLVKFSSKNISTSQAERLKESFLIESSLVIFTTGT